MKKLLTCFFLFCLFSLILAQNCAQFQNTEQCLRKPIQEQEACIEDLHDKLMDCQFSNFGETGNTAQPQFGATGSTSAKPSTTVTPVAQPKPTTGTTPGAKPTVTAPVAKPGTPAVTTPGAQPTKGTPSPKPSTGSKIPKRGSKGRKGSKKGKSKKPKGSKKDKPTLVNPPKPKPECKLGTVSKPNKCICKFKYLCTKKLCVCFKTLDTCLQTSSFSRRKVCLCGQGKKRKCVGTSCICESSTSKDSQDSKKPKKKIPQCPYGKVYNSRSCLCNRFQRCQKAVGSKPSQCICHEKAPACPTGTGKNVVSFDRKLLCNCKVRGMVRECKGTKCVCKKVQECNLHRNYASRTSCFCGENFYFMACLKNKDGKKICKCRHLDQQCEQNKVVKRGTCFCNLKDNTWDCKVQNKGTKKQGTFCVCRKKKTCPVGEYVKRASCKCWRKPTSDLQDENSEKKRVLRSYGWKKCKPVNKKDPWSERKCKCEPLKCYEAGRFKKYFCKCPRKTVQKCNKKTDYCKCLPKSPIKYRYAGNYKFQELIDTKSKIIASYKFEKRIIKVYTEEGKKKVEKRYIFVDHENGSYRVVKKPTITTEKQIRAELALYDKNDENNKFIQEQIKAKVSKK